jgi:hypothetical protein
MDRHPTRTITNARVNSTYTEGNKLMMLNWDAVLWFRLHHITIVFVTTRDKLIDWFKVYSSDSASDDLGDKLVLIETPKYSASQQVFIAHLPGMARIKRNLPREAGAHSLLRPSPNTTQLKNKTDKQPHQAPSQKRNGDVIFVFGPIPNRRKPDRHRNNSKEITLNLRRSKFRTWQRSCSRVRQYPCRTLGCLPRVSWWP